MAYFQKINQTTLSSNLRNLKDRLYNSLQNLKLFTFNIEVISDHNLMNQRTCSCLQADIIIFPCLLRIKICAIYSLLSACMLLGLCSIKPRSRFSFFYLFCQLWHMSIKNRFMSLMFQNFIIFFSLIESNFTVKWSQLGNISKSVAVISVLFGNSDNIHKIQFP